jgi:hypothetical protein
MQISICLALMAETLLLGFVLGVLFETSKKDKKEVETQPASHEATIQKSFDKSI